MTRRSVALVATALLLLPAAAQGQVATPDGITVTGVGRVAIEPPSRQTETSVQRAVDEAARRALPLAVEDARENAELLAEAASLEVGPIRAVQQTGSSVLDLGTFGVEGFCRERTVRRRTGTGALRRSVQTVCRVPELARVVVSVSFAGAGDPVSGGDEDGASSRRRADLD